jgi:hypothetical protein
LQLFLPYPVSTNNLVSVTRIQNGELPTATFSFSQSNLAGHPMKLLTQTRLHSATWKAPNCASSIKTHVPHLIFLSATRLALKCFIPRPDTCLRGLARCRKDPTRNCRRIRENYIQALNSGGGGTPMRCTSIDPWLVERAGIRGCTFTLTDEAQFITSH